ncbi:MAG: hypothetical protein ACOCUV_00125 [bacterium]
MGKDKKYNIEDLSKQIEIIHNEIDVGYPIWQITEIYRCTPLRSYIYKIPTEFARKKYSEFTYYSYSPN